MSTSRENAEPASSASNSQERQATVSQLHIHLVNSELLLRLGDDTLRISATEPDDNPRFLGQIEQILQECSFTDPLKLERGPLEDLRRKLKITAELLCLMRMRSQSDELSCEECVDIKELFPEEDAGRCKEILLEVAYSFSNYERWTAGHIEAMLAIFHTLGHVLFSIRHLYSSVSEFSRVAGIVGEMKYAFCGILDRSANDIENESSIHTSTEFLKTALGTFHDNRVQVEAIFGPGDYAADLHDRWLSKLEQDAEKKFKDGTNEVCIFMLMNTYYVLRLQGGLSDAEKQRLEDLKTTYIDRYLGYWSQLVDVPDGDPVSQPTAYLRSFNANFRRAWKLQEHLNVEDDGLRRDLREGLKQNTVERHRKYYDETEQPNRSPACWSFSIIPWWRQGTATVDPKVWKKEIDSWGKDIDRLFPYRP